MQIAISAFSPSVQMAGGAIVSALWRLNVDGAIIARLLFDATEHKFSGVLTIQSYQKLSTRAPAALVPFVLTYLCESGLSSFLST